MKDLNKEKEALKREWERCFEMPITEKLNEKGIAKFWDYETTVEEAEEMLDAAAISLLVESAIGPLENLVGNLFDGSKKIIIFAGSPDNEPCKGEQPKEQFVILRKPDNYIYEGKFRNEEDARECIKEICMNSEYKVDDFTILQEMD